MQARRKRSPAHIRGDGLDHVQINLTLSGRSDYRAAGRDLALVAGSVVLIDYGLPTRGVIAEGFESIVITAPRNDFRRFAVDVNVLHGVELDGAARALVEGHLVALIAYLRSASADDAARMVDATIALIAACLPQQDKSRRNSASDISLDALRLFIEENAFRPDCDAALVQSAFNLSRATLYRLAAPLGGVSAYVTRCRLERARAMIRADGPRMSMVRISQACGFTSPSHFTRLFHRRFGHPPSRPAAATRPPVQAEDKLEAYARFIEEAGGAPPGADSTSRT